MIDFLRPCPNNSIDIFEMQKYLGKNLIKVRKNIHLLPVNV